LVGYLFNVNLHVGVNSLQVRNVQQGLADVLVGYLFNVNIHVGVNSLQVRNVQQGLADEVRDVQWTDPATLFLPS